MNFQVRLGAVVGLLTAIAPLVAAADDIVTISYQSSMLSGSYSYLPTGLANYSDLPTASFSGQIAGSLTFDLSAVQANGAVIPMSDTFTLTGTGIDGGVSLYSTYPVFVTNGACMGGPNCAGITTNNQGTVTGFTVDLEGNSYHAPQTFLTIGALGDSASYEFADTGGSCDNRLFGAPGGSYGGSAISPCKVTATSSEAGSFTESVTEAPEINAGSAASALTLLLGCIAMLRGRRVLV